MFVNICCSFFLRVHQEIILPGNASSGSSRIGQRTCSGRPGGIWSGAGHVCVNFPILLHFNFRISFEFWHSFFVICTNIFTLYLTPEVMEVVPGVTANFRWFSCNFCGEGGEGSEGRNETQQDQAWSSSSYSCMRFSSASCFLSHSSSQASFSELIAARFFRSSSIFSRPPA